MLRAILLVLVVVLVLDLLLGVNRSARVTRAARFIRLNQRGLSYLVVPASFPQLTLTLAPTTAYDRVARASR
jgi:hypothetical protein